MRITLEMSDGTKYGARLNDNEHPDEVAKVVARTLRHIRGELPIMEIES